MKAFQPGAWLRRSQSLHLSVTILLLLGGLGGLLTLLVSRSAYAAGNVQINAGGSAAAPFVVDADFSGGKAGSSTTKAINTSNVTRAC